MNLLIYVFTSLWLVAGCLSAQVKSDLKAIPVIITYCSALPDGLDRINKPSNHKKGLGLTFFLRGENILGVDEKSFKAEGWTMKYSVCKKSSDKNLVVTLYNEGFKGKLNDFKFSAAVDVLFGITTKTTKILFKKGDKPVKFLGFTLEANQRGVKVVGEQALIKAISIVRDGRDEFSSRDMSDGNSKTFMFNGIQDTDEIRVTYWSDFKVKTVKLVR